MTNLNNYPINRLILILLIIGFIDSFDIKLNKTNDLFKNKEIKNTLIENRLIKTFEDQIINQTINQINNQTNDKIINKLNYQLNESNISNNISNKSIKLNNQINQLINLTLFNSLTKINKLNDENRIVNTNNSLNNKSYFNKTIINLTNNLINNTIKINSSNNISNLEQMSFIDSIDKLINLTYNDHLNISNKINREIKRNQIQNNDTKLLLNLEFKNSKLINLTNKDHNSNNLSLISINNTNSFKLNKTIIDYVHLIKNTTQSSPFNYDKINKFNSSSIDKLMIIEKMHNSRLQINETKNNDKINQKIIDLKNQTIINHQQNEEDKKEKVLVYPIKVNQLNNQSSSQFKRAPHYLEEKFRIQLSTTTSTTTKSPPERLDRPTPILDTKPLLEEVNNELNLKELNERLINEEGGLIHHHGSSIEDSSYEYGNHHSTHHLNHHSFKQHNNDQLNDKQNLKWFEQNCLKNCTCELDGKWIEVYGQSRKTLNCSNAELNDYPILINEFSKHVERLILNNNNLKTIQIDNNQFHCERLLELDLSNNQLQQLTINSINYKQHPLVEFHFSHHHKDEELNLLKLPQSITTTNQPFINSTNAINSSTTTIQLTTPLSTKLNDSITKQNSFTHSSLFTSCHRLRILMLSGNDLNTLTTGCFRGLKRLKKLYLDNSQIKYIEKNAFLSANELHLLSLRFNLLTKIHSDMFQHMINLRVLDLTGNSLVYLGVGVFNSLVALQALHLGHNKLKQLNFQCFSGLDGLQLLTINSNQLENVPRFALQPLKKLKILEMSSNPINKILEDDFSHSFVQLLLLNHLNQLQHIARFAFWDLPYLNELQITHCNQFVHLDEQSIVGAPALHRLRLDHNAISQLDDRLLENLARMTIAARRQLKVHLAGNKFLCDCFLKPLYLCARDQAQCKIELPDRENITCTLIEDKNITKSDNSTEVITTKTSKLYRIEELSNNQLSNECAPTFLPIVTPVNTTIVKRLRSKLTLYCKAQGVPVPNVYWLQPTGEIHKEKLTTRHTHDLMEKDLLTSPHSFQNDDTGLLLGNEQLAIEQNENLLSNQATAAFLPYTNGVLMSTSTRTILPSNIHHGSSTLKINHLTPKSAGLYVCVAENKLKTIRSHVLLITQQLKIELDVENTSVNFITIKWQVHPIFNPPLSEILGTNNYENLNETSTAQNLTSNILLNKNYKLEVDEALENAKYEQNQLDYQLLYKLDPFILDEDKQTSSETLGSERTFESNKFFASYENIQINKQLKTFTIAGLRSGSRYKICIAIKESRLNELELSNGGLFRKRAIRRFRRLFKRNLISVESANYLAINCLHSETSHAALNILRVEKFQLPMILSTAFGTALKVTFICLVSAIVIILILITYTWTKQIQRRSSYETPRKTLLSLAGLSQFSNTPNSTPTHSRLNNENPAIQMENIYSPLMQKRKRY